MDVDYSPSSVEPSIPINWVQLGNGSASRAPYKIVIIILGGG